jgi:hypothetical protein
MRRTRNHFINSTLINIAVNLTSHIIDDDKYQWILFDKIRTNNSLEGNVDEHCVFHANKLTKTTQQPFK